MIIKRNLVKIKKLIKENIQYIIHYSIPTTIMCDHSQDKLIDIEAINTKFDEHIAKRFDKPKDDDIIKFKPMIDSLLNGESLIKLRREYSFSHKQSFLYVIFLLHENEYTKEQHKKIKSILKIKAGKSHSGIISVTIFTSPYPEYIDDNGNLIKQSFSCAYNCHYCPNEPDQPRSYLKGEPGVLRANREEFDCVKQMYIRMEALYLTGHDIDKLEVLVLGGTWSSYPIKYREIFIRDMYYAANTYKEHMKNVIKNSVREIRPRLSMVEEKIINRSATTRVIGLTLETRPDQINKDELILFRLYGCTRVQLGVQHIDNDVLDRINRKCSTEITIKALELLKDCCYKIDIHLMPNLPGSSIKKDELMFDKLLGVKYKKYITNTWEKYTLTNPELQADQWKIYPTTITPFTEIKKWYEEGSYIPYSNDELYNLIYKVHTIIFKSIRINRCIRDIPADYVYKSDYFSNMRQDVENEVLKNGLRCNCIRCREVKNGIYNKENSQICVMEYNASNGTEYFISCESLDKTVLYGFIRLRLKANNYNCLAVFPELFECALIRELHVYGQLNMVGQKNNQNNQSQHYGIGKTLLEKAESIAIHNNYKRIAVISGEGVREYYNKRGYCENHSSGNFMIKVLDNSILTRIKKYINL